MKGADDTGCRAVTRRRTGWLGRVVVKGRKYWRAVVMVDGRRMTKTSVDREVCEAWRAVTVERHPTYTQSSGLKGGWRPRRCTVRRRVDGRGREYWRAEVTVDGRTLSRRSADRVTVERWLAEVLRENPVCRWGPRGAGVGEAEAAADAGRLMAALPGIHFKYRPDIGLTVVWGYDPADLQRHLGWGATRLAAAIDRLTGERRMVTHVTPWGFLHQPVVRTRGMEMTMGLRERYGKIGTFLNKQE